MQGIVHQKSRADTPQHNGGAERCMRTVKTKAIIIMQGIKGPWSLWSEALPYAVYLCNLSPTAGKKDVPYKAF